MSQFKHIATNVNILTKGWLARSFILLLWIAAMAAPFLIDESKLYIVMLFIGFSNAFMYLLVAGRVLLLARYHMRNMLPNYFSVLKKSLAIILLVSLLPTLVLLPHFSLWFTLITICLAMAILFIAMTYQQKFYWLFIILMFMPMSLQKLPVPWAEYEFDVQVIVSYFAPIFVWWAYYLLNRLETFKGDEKHIARVMALTSLKMKSSFVSQDSIPLKSRHRVWQWLIKSNFHYYRQLIAGNKILKNSQLIEIACQGSASVGRFTYMFWALAVITFSIIGNLFTEQAQLYLVPMMIVFPAMIIGAGTIVFFQVINSKKSLLQRLAISPVFQGKQGFTQAFLIFVMTNQLKLYGFIYLVVGLLAYTFHHLTFATYLNVMIAGASLCLLNLVIMLRSWSSKYTLENVSLWLMVSLFIGFLVFMSVVVVEEEIVLYTSSIFMVFFSCCMLLLAGTVYRSYQRLSQRFA